MNNLTLLLLTTLAFVALIDYVPKLINASKPLIRVKPGYDKKPNYLLMPTVYGDISYLKNVRFLKKYADKVIICTSRYETKEFYSDLRAICKANGLRYITVDLPKTGGQPIKNAYTIYKGAFSNPRRLGVPRSTPCILIDADTDSPKNLNNLVRTFNKNGLDIASLRCEVKNPRKLFEVLQAYEYRLAMDNRRSDSWLTSGACNIAKASVFRHVFKHHSNFFAGGDIEIGKLAHIMGYRVGHISFTFYTEVPANFGEWYRQRVIWFAGGVRHHVVNIGSFSWQHYFILFYNSLLVYLLLPLRWLEFVNYPLTFFLLTCIAWLYMFVANIGRGWRKEYLLFPAYAFLQSMVILPVAMVRYVKYAWQQRSLGILQFDLSHLRLRLQLSFRALNFALTFLVVFSAGYFTEQRMVYWSDHGRLHTLMSTVFSNLL
ncbi:MAG: N-acetylglucosaminyltransferase [Candidatus Saccharibacteria bacterium]|nr:N-acetylglucosaminyltransferase [Candidatus Saccharibacteria bacterium]